jgi:hypothetical protein
MTFSLMTFISKRFTLKIFTLKSFLHPEIFMSETRLNSTPPARSAFRRLAWCAGPAVLAAAFMTSAALAASDDRPDRGAASGGTPAARVEHRQEWIRSRLEQAANRLEIKASQQSAWEAFAQSVQAFAVPPAAARPARDADAIARFRADRAGENARKLAQVADATAKLQSVLGPDQRKVLDEMAHRFMHRGHHRHGEDSDHYRHGEGPEHHPREG